MHFLSLLALAAPLVSAIQFVAPVANVTLSKGQTYSVKWNSVDTDPTTFSIYLVNFVNWPPFYTQVAYDIPTSEGQHEVTVPCNVDSSWGFQFNAINGTNVYVIHAQTPKFFVKDGACSGAAPPVVSNGPAPACTSAVTVSQISTTTVTVSASATDLAPASCPAPATVTVKTTIPAETTSASTTTTLAVVSSAVTSVSLPASSVTTVAVPVQIESSVPALPSVTRPASLVAPVGHEAGKPQSTSTIYLTVYKDLSEVEDECMLCRF